MDVRVARHFALARILKSLFHQRYRARIMVAIGFEVRVRFRVRYSFRSSVEVRNSINVGSWPRSNCCRIVCPAAYMEIQPSSV